MQFLRSFFDLKPCSNLSIRWSWQFALYSYISFVRACVYVYVCVFVFVLPPYSGYITATT